MSIPSKKNSLGTDLTMGKQFVCMLGFLKRRFCVLDDGVRTAQLNQKPGPSGLSSCGRNSGKQPTPFRQRGISFLASPLT